MKARAAKNEETKKKKGKGKGGRKGTKKGARRGKAAADQQKRNADAPEEEYFEVSQEEAPKKDTAVLVSPLSPDFSTFKSSDYIVDMDKDILEMEAPTFTTLIKVGCAALDECSWDMPAEMIGGKVPCPLIHCCESCDKPILIYGRMIPCKHVFCITCAAKDRKNCQRCGADADRIDNVRLGSIYMCTEGGRRYGKDGCRRTYMSPRDLQAHINHRHTGAAALMKQRAAAAAAAAAAQSGVDQPGSQPVASTSSTSARAPLSIEINSSHGGHHHPPPGSHHQQPGHHHMRGPVSPRQANMTLTPGGSRRLLSPAGSGAAHPAGPSRHHHHHGHLHHHHVSPSVPPPSISKMVRPPRISPGMSLPPLLNHQSSDMVSSTGLDNLYLSTAPPQSSSSSSSTHPPLASPIPVLSTSRSSSAAGSNLIAVPIQDSVSSSDSPAYSGSGYSRPPPPVNVAYAAVASNYYATTAPPPLPASGCLAGPQVETTSTSPYPQLNLNVPPPNYLPRSSWSQGSGPRGDHTDYFH